MTAAVSIDRYRGEWSLLATLAAWLRDTRASAYPTMIAKGLLSEADAYRDQHARDAIAEDWRAIAADEPRSGPDVPPWWKLWTLEQALAGAETRLRMLPADNGKIADHTDLRDAIACMLFYQRCGSGHPINCQAAMRVLRAAEEGLRRRMA